MVSRRIPDYLWPSLGLLALAAVVIVAMLAIDVFNRDTTPDCGSYTRYYYEAGFAPVSCYKDTMLER